MYINRLLGNVKKEPLEVFVGLCVFFVAVMGTAVHHVASTVLAIMFISSVFFIKNWIISWQQLSNSEKWVLTGFSIYALSGVIAFINVQDVQEYIKEIERYLRFLAIVPVYLFIKNKRINVISYLYAGVIVSGPFLLFIAIQSYMANPHGPATGWYHHTIFGSAAMLNFGVMLVLLMIHDFSKALKLLIIFSMISALIAAILSQSRGVWLMLPLYMFMVMYYSFKKKMVSAKGVVLVIALLTGVIVISPVNNIIQTRVSSAVEEVHAFYNKGNYVSSLGTRLAMWEIVIKDWKKTPVFGSGPGDFDDLIRELQEAGEYKGMDVLTSTHSIYFQSLFNAGLVGFLALVFGVVFMPARIMLMFIDKSKTASLSGLIVILLFTVTGLSMSWVIRSPAIAVYLLYTITILSSLYLTNDSVGGINKLNPHNHNNEK